MSRGFKFSLAILVIVILAIITYMPWSSGGRQFINMKVAERWLPGVEAVVRGNRSFDHVKVMVYTGQDGALLFGGHVATNDDLFGLMKTIAELRLPVATAWYIEVEENWPRDETE